jgi:hypothetical protein
MSSFIRLTIELCFVLFIYLTQLLCQNVKNVIRNQPLNVNTLLLRLVPIY